MVPYSIKKGDKCIVKYDQDCRGISYISKPLLQVQWRYLLDASVKLMFGVLSPFSKEGRCVRNMIFHSFYLFLIFNIQIEIRFIRFKGMNFLECLSGFRLCVVLRDDTVVLEDL